MELLNIVIDTNILISAFKSIKGASYLLLENISEKKFKINISIPLFLEYEEVLKRNFGKNIDDVEVVLSYLLQNSNKHEIYYLYRDFLKDSDDSMILELAIKSNSKYIITFNKRDFIGIDKFGIETFTPKEFLEKIGVLKCK